jgi:hypothetical protein
LAGLSIRKIQSCIDQCSLFLHFDLFETSLDEFTSGGDNRIQIAFTGAVAGHAEFDFFFGQRQQTLRIALDRTIEPFIVSQYTFQLLGIPLCQD